MANYNVKYLLTGDQGDLEVVETGRVTADSTEDAHTQAEAAGVARGIDPERIEVELADPNDDATVQDVTRVERS